MENLVNDLSAERSVVGTLIMYNRMFYAVQEDISPECFYNKKCEIIFNAFVTMLSEGKEVDVISIMAYMSSHKSGVPVNADDITEIIDCCLPSELLLKQHVTRLKELCLRRDLWRTGCQLINVGTNEGCDIQEALNAMNGVGIAAESNKTQSMKSVVCSMDKIVSDNRNGNKAQGINTGFACLDSRFGLHLGDLTIIAAETSQGKTSFALCLCLNVAAKGVPVVFYSMEMNAQQLTARMAATISGVNSNRILYAPLNDEEKSNYELAAKHLKTLPIFFDDKSTSSIENILLSIRANTRKNKTKIAVIDYLQILGTNQSIGNTEQFYGDVSRKLKNLAKELDICIIALSQLNRDRNNPEPNLARLRASGQIAEAADVVLLLYRPEYYGKSYKDSSIDTKGTALLTIAKGRNIGVGEEVIGFNAETTYFFDLNGRIPKLDANIMEELEDTRPF